MASTDKWIHAYWSTFGVWLPGDPRGFRSRGHRIHSSGNYKDPPPTGEHAGLWLHARRMVKQQPVYLLKGQMRAALGALKFKAE